MWTGTRVPRNTGFPPMTLPFNRSWSALGSSGLARPGRRRCARFQKQSEKIKRCGKPFKGSRIQRVSGPVPKSRYLHNCPACAAGGGRGDAGGRDRLSPRRARRGLRPSSEWALLAAVSNEPGCRRWGSLESVVLLMGNRGFESTSLQERVHCELDQDVELAVDVEITRHEQIAEEIERASEPGVDTAPSQGNRRTFKRNPWPITRGLHAGQPRDRIAALAGSGRHS